MAAPTIHLLSSASFAASAISDPISASIEDGGSVQEYVSADSAFIKLVAVDRIGATVTVTSTKFAPTPAVGDTGALALVLTARAEGKGVTGTPVNITYANAVCTGRSSGPVIEGSPSYAFTFRAHAAP